MAAYGRPSLRDLFDESPTPHIAHPPRTHHRDFYLATDGSFRESGGGLGAVIETRDGQRVARLSLADAAPDNNVAEYRALHLGLDVLAARAPADAHVGVLIDHDDLAANVNAAVLAAQEPGSEPPHDVSVPEATGHHWRGIQARLRGFDAIRAARISGDVNPAHPLANAPDEYAHVNREPDRCVLPSAPVDDERIPPPSRSDRPASDWLLIGMPVVFLLSLVAHVRYGIPLPVGLGTAGLVSAILLVDAIYLNPPLPADAGSEVSSDGSTDQGFSAD